SAYSSDSTADIRSVRWGMTVAQVKQAESQNPANEGSDGPRKFLIYLDKLRGLEAGVAFIFISDKLVRVKYSISGKHANKTDYVGDYVRLLAALREKYGKPMKDETIWKNDLYKDDPTDWGTAVALGQLVKYAQWKAPRTNINLMLMGDNYE